jgi:hypothetical protein
MSCLTVCTLFLVTGCAVERWRPEHSTPGEAELPRIDLSIVRMAQANERVGANQIFDGTPYVVRDTRYFPIGEAILASDAKGYPAVAFRVRSEAIPEFELWTQQNVGYGMGVALDGQLIFVLKLQGPLKGGFAINGGRYGWRPGQAEAIVRRCNATRVTREAAYRAEGGGSEAQ